MDIAKYKDLGLTGLANIGNTCYLNSYVCDKHCKVEFIKQVLPKF